MRDGWVSLGLQECGRKTETPPQRAEPGWWEVARAPPLPEWSSSHCASGEKCTSSGPPCLPGTRKQIPGLGRERNPDPAKSQAGSRWSWQSRKQAGPGLSSHQGERLRVIQPRAQGSQPAPHCPTEILPSSLRNPSTLEPEPGPVKRNREAAAASR